MNTIPQEQLSLTSRIRYRTVDNESVLIHLENDRVIVVNEVGLYIVQQLASPQTRQALADCIASHFDTDAEQAASDLDRYITELDKEQVLKHHHVQD